MDYLIDRIVSKVRGLSDIIVVEFSLSIVIWIIKIVKNYFQKFDKNEPSISIILPVLFISELKFDGFDGSSFG